MAFKIPPDLNWRLYYLERIRPFIGKNIVKVFTGQRRVGKSYLLFQVIKFLQEQNPIVNILCINNRATHMDYTYH